MQTCFASRSAAVIVFVAAGLTTASASAQAILPDKGESTVAILFTSSLATRHYLPVEALDRGHIDANSVLFDFTHALSNRVAISASLPVVSTRYRGTNPHRDRDGGHVGLDSGSWHATIQDLRFTVRYNAAEWRGVFITPFLGSITPSHSYDYFAHAAPGRAMHELLTGVSLARVFTSTGIFVQGRYAYGVGERIAGFRPLHSEGLMEVGYFVSPRFRVLGLASGRYGHNGIDVTTLARATLPWDQYVNHDRIAREHALNAGAAVSVTLSDTVELFSSAATTLAGRNTHGLKYAITTGLSWTVRESDATRAARKPTTALKRCLCQKGRS